MDKSSPSLFVRGIEFIKKNPQIFSTVFLLFAIPLAFLYTSQQFLQVASKNQEQLESGRVTLMQDLFVEFVSEHLEDSGYLNDRIRSLAKENETIADFRVLKNIGAQNLEIIASKNTQEVGTTYTIADEQEKFQFDQSASNPTQTILSEIVRGGERHWLAVRSIVTASSSLSGYLVTDVSMANADAIASKNIRDAYIVLGFVLVLIFLLLLRQARIIDYAALYGRLKEVDQMKDDFVSMAAHELRSPLTVIRGYVEMLGEEAQFDEKGKRYLGNIDMAAASLNTLIGDILDVSRLQEGRMSFQIAAVDLVPIVTTVVDSFDRPAKDKGLAISLAPALSPIPFAMVDAERFRQVIINLIGNAIKYTPTGAVTVSVTAKGDSVIVRVSDTGMGISAEDQSRLFQKFYRIKNKETESITGTGLGLWITSQMVLAMKGLISVESIRGKGSDFIVRFPSVVSSTKQEGENRDTP